MLYFFVIFMEKVNYTAVNIRVIHKTNHEINRFFNNK